MNREQWVKSNCKFAQIPTPPPTPPVIPPAPTAPVTPQPAPQEQHPKILKVYDTRTELYQEGDETIPGDPQVEDENEVDCNPDEFDLEDNLDAAMIAARYILRSNQGNLEPSSSSYHEGLWYTSNDTDFRTGDILERSFHPKGFSPEEGKKIFDIINQKRRGG
jgi:hypothetical protein